jgi:predicted HicB family RNase H-like nuclease
MPRPTSMLINLSLEPDAFAALLALAATRGVSLDALVSEAIAEFLQERRRD